MGKKLDLSILGPQIIELGNQGIIAKNIAKYLKISRNIVDKFVKDNNVKLKDGRGAGYKKEHFPCVVCGTMFHVKRCHYETGTSTTCSRKCSLVVRSKANPRYAKVEVQCERCNNRFLVKPSKVKSARFCSRECQHPSKPLHSIECQRCKKIFYHKEQRQFCSSECSNGKPFQPVQVCKICKQRFQYKLSEERIFCSKKCANEGQKFHNKFPEKLEVIKQLVQNGTPYLEIGKQVNLEESSISTLVGKYDFQPKYIRNKSRQEAKVKEFLSELLGEPILNGERYPNS